MFSLYISFKYNMYYWNYSVIKANNLANITQTKQLKSKTAPYYYISTEHEQKCIISF